MNKSILIYSATQKSNFWETSLSKSNVNGDFDFAYNENNKTSLPIRYNQQIAQAIEMDYTWLVLMHDDVTINCTDVVQRIHNYGSIYDVFGLAGTTEITLDKKKPVLWHLLSGRDKHRGCVAHGNKDQYYYTSFGPLPSRALLVDGVFLCINLKKLPVHVRFDEKCPSGFHFYDLLFCMECALHKVKVGVGDIPIIHESPGLKEYTKDWLAGNEYFLEKHYNLVGKTVTI